MSRRAEEEKENQYRLRSSAFKLACGVGPKRPLGGVETASTLQCGKKGSTVVRAALRGRLVRDVSRCATDL